MSWRSATDVYRVPITVDNSAGGAGAFDATLALPSDFGLLRIGGLANGNDVRVTGSSGDTLVTKLDLESYNLSAVGSPGTVEIQDTAAAAGMLLYWLYFGDSTLSNGETAFAPASAKTAYIDLGQPVPGYTFPAYAQERLQDTSSRNQLAKTSDSTIFVWLDFSALLQTRVAPNNGQYEMEMLDRVTVTAAAGLTSTSSGIRFESTGPGTIYVRCQLSGGTTANSYLVTVTAVTTLGRTLTGKVTVVVRDIAT